MPPLPSPVTRLTRHERLTRLARLPKGVRWVRARVNEVFSPLGVTVIAMGAVALVVGLKLDWEEIVVAGTACVVVTALSSMFLIGRSTLEIAIGLDPSRVVAGERAVGRLSSRNATGHRSIPLRIEAPVGIGVARFDVPSLAAGGVDERSFVIPTSRRGIVIVGPVRSVRGDPLGLVRRTVDWTDTVELFVHPQTVFVPGFAAGWIRDLDGQATNDRSPSDVAFHTLRPYVVGDDRRHIHWRTSARMRSSQGSMELMVRQFVDTRRAHLGLVLANAPADYADADEFELAVSVAGSLGLAGLRADQMVSFVCGAQPVAAHAGSVMLDGLARVELGAKGSADLAGAGLQASRTCSAASVVALVSGSATSIDQFRLAGERFASNVTVIGVRAELDAPARFMRFGRLSVMSVGSLDQLPDVMFTVARR